jgi:hypothetical protein
MIVCINGSRSLTDSRLLERAIEQAEQEGIQISSIRKRKKRVVEVPSEEIEGPNLGA